MRESDTAVAAVAAAAASVGAVVRGKPCSSFVSFSGTLFDVFAVWVLEPYLFC